MSTTDTIAIFALLVADVGTWVAASLRLVGSL
jgi:hypothetical protein